MKFKVLGLLYIWGALLIQCGSNPLGSSSDSEINFDPAEEFDTEPEPEEEVVEEEEEEVVEEEEEEVVEEETQETSTTTTTTATKPTITGLTSSTSYATSHTWSWGCSTGSCTYRYLIDTNTTGTPSGDYTSTTSYTQSSGAGTYYIHVQALSADGVASDISSVSALIDAQAPQVSGTIDISAGDGVVRSSPTMIWSAATDAHSGISQYDVMIVIDSGDSSCNATDLDATAALSWTTMPSSTEFSSTGWQITNGGVDNSGSSISLLLNNSTYCAIVRVSDVLGNVSYIYSSSTFTVWTPSSITSIISWWDAAKTSSLYTDSSCSTNITSNGDSIGCWQDLTGNNNATQSSSSAQPVYKSSATNSLPSVQFSGSQSLQVAGGSAGPLATISSGDFGVYIVSRINTNAGDQWFISNYDGSQGFEFGSSSNTVAAEVGDDGIANSAYTTGSNYHLYFMQRSGTDFSMYRDVEAGSTFTRSDDISTSKDTYLGQNGDSATDFLDGEILEVVIVNAIPSGAESLSLANYFENKWGVNVVP